MKSSKLVLQSTTRSRLNANTADIYPKVTNYKLGKLSKWRRIISMRRLLERRHPKKQRCSLLNLPLDIIYTIADELTLPARIILSQTCRDLWHLLHGDCLSAFRTASVMERLDCLTVLEQLLPDHRLCTGCCALQSVDHEEGVPGRFCPFDKPRFSRFLVSGSYAIAFPYVQLAIKYGSRSRYQGTRKQYYPPLLPKFSISVRDFFSWKLDFSAEKLVAKGRFLLKTTHVLRGVIQPLSLLNTSKAPVAICPHLSLGVVHPIAPGEPIPAALRMAYDEAGDPVGLDQDLHCCARCPTDFLVSNDGDDICIMVWTDLGNGTSPQDPFWRSHLLSNENSRLDGKTFDHRPGSIQEMYINNDV